MRSLQIAFFRTGGVPDVRAIVFFFREMNDGPTDVSHRQGIKPKGMRRYERSILVWDAINLSASSGQRLSAVVSSRMAASCMGSTRVPVASWSRLAMRSSRRSVRGAMGMSRLSLQPGSVGRPPPGGTRRDAPGLPPRAALLRDTRPLHTLALASGLRDLSRSCPYQVFSCSSIPREITDGKVFPPYPRCNPSERLAPRLP